MKIFELFLKDLTDDAKTRFLDFINDPDNIDNNYNIYPIATIESKNETDVRLNAAIKNILSNLASVLELTDGDETDAAFLRDILPMIDKQECIPEEVRRGIQDCLSRISEESIYGKDSVRMRYPYSGYAKPYVPYRRVEKMCPKEEY